jgi:type II secretory ATPase GspE/PulE/Tfp pilus assembly ATPase PilB-like protein/intein/homing endonuclease
MPSPPKQLVLTKDKLPELIGELALYPQEQWIAASTGQTDSVKGTNETLWAVYKEIEEMRWLRETTTYLFCRAERIREVQRAKGGTPSEFAYIPIPGLKNGTRIKHPCEAGQKSLKSILSKSPPERSRELAWLIPYKTSTGEKTLIFIFTFDPLWEIEVRTNTAQWEKCVEYWGDAVEAQGLLKAGEQVTFLHAFTGLHEWMGVLEGEDGEQTPQSWRRHKITQMEAAHGANRGLDIYYSNPIVAYAWSTLEKQKGRERARMLLQQDLCKRVILFDPVYGKIQGLKSEAVDLPPNFLLGGDTEKEKISKSFWDNTIRTAHTSGASDIHIEPMQVVGQTGCDLIVSLRKDAQLNFHTKVPSELAHDFVRYALETSGVIKEENRRPQDGRRGWVNPQTKEAIDLRISVTPVGAPIQKIVMRLLDTNKLKRGISDLGLEPDEVKLWDAALKLNQSLVLVSGPTNSGKSLVGWTPIKTDKGILPLEEVVRRHEAGERFKTWNETGWEPITNVHHCGTKEIIEIHTNGGTVLEAAGTHPFRSCTENLEGVWKKTNQLKVGDQLLFLGKSERNQIGDWDKYHLLGAWLGDGNLILKKKKGGYVAAGYKITAGKACSDLCPEYLEQVDKTAQRLWGSNGWKAEKRCVYLAKSSKAATGMLIAEGMGEEKRGYKKALPRSLWTATSFEIAAFFAGWIDTDGHCKGGRIEITTKELGMARDAKTLLASIGIRCRISLKFVRKCNGRVINKTYARIMILGARNIVRLLEAGCTPKTNYKLAGMIRGKEERRNDKISFQVDRLGNLQNKISAAIQQAYGPQKRSVYKEHLKLGTAGRKKIGLNTLRRVFDKFPRALPLLPGLKYLLKNDMEPEEVVAVKRTGKKTEMFDIEVGKNHTYTIQGIICHNSTSLYAALLTIYQRDTRRSFATIEDPVEYRLPFRSTQSPVHEESGVTYERLIRQAMRNDGDTFLIGEIRDGATANAALQLSLTGHQVLSSIHANSATETALRLLEFKVDPYILSETLKMVVAQRLIPTCCPHCRREIEEGEVARLLRRYGGEIPMESLGPLWEKKYRRKAKWIEGEGCPQCQFTGLSGMTAAQEFLVIDHKNRGYLKEGNMVKLEESMKEKSLLRMEEIAWRLAWQGRIPMSQAGELTNQLKSK